VDEKKSRLKKAFQYDVNGKIPFRCLIGKTDAELHIMIEPDPHGDESGNHSHFHTVTMCPNIKIVDTPEPDRCRITNGTCPFIAPFGSDERSPELRKFRYANEIIQKIAFIEFYGSQLVNKILQKKKLAPIRYSLRVAELEKILIVSDLIDAETYRKVGNLRRIRNKLAHSPKEYLKFSEKELYECSKDADRLSFLVADLLKNTNKKETTFGSMIS
jgi:hypothetical protein